MNVNPVRPKPHIFTSDVLIRLFADFTRAGVRYAVLRNHEQLPFSLDARDLDLIILPADRRKAVDVVIALATDFGLLFSNHYQDERMTQIGLVCRRQEGLFDLKIDFFTSSQVFGIELLSAEEMMRDLRWHNGLPVVSELVLLLDKFLFHLAVGKALHPKYDRLFGAIARGHRPQLTKSLTPLLGEAAARQCVETIASGNASRLVPLVRGRRLRMLGRMWNGRRAGGLSLMARFLLARVRQRLRPHGLLVSVSGPDGSGKTTVIDLVLAQLRQSAGADSVAYLHFRPKVLPRIAEIARATKAVNEVDTDYSRPHRASPSGFAGSLVRLGYYGMDYVLGYARIVRPALMARKIVLFDRYFHDMICDPGRSRIGLPAGWLRAVGRLMPRPRFAFFIHVSPEVAHARKQELTQEQIATLNRRYRDLVRRGWMVEISNMEAAEQAAAAIVDRIFAHYDHRARRALGMASR